MGRNRNRCRLSHYKKPMCTKCGQEHEDGLEHVTIKRAKCPVCERMVKALAIRKNGQLVHRADTHTLPGNPNICIGSMQPIRVVDVVVWPVKDDKTIKEIYDELTQ